MLTPEEKEQIAAVRDSDGRGLPIEAIIASNRHLAKRCLELDEEIRFLATPTVPPPMPTLDQLLPDRHKPKLPPPGPRSAPMDSTPYDEASMDPTKVGYPPPPIPVTGEATGVAEAMDHDLKPPKPLAADPRDLP